MAIFDNAVRAACSAIAGLLVLLGIIFSLIGMIWAKSYNPLAEW